MAPFRDQYLLTWQNLICVAIDEFEKGGGGLMSYSYCKQLFLLYTMRLKALSEKSRVSERE